MWRNIETGAVKTEREIRYLNKNVSFGKPFSPPDYEPVLPSPQPSCTKHEAVRRVGPIQDDLGNWVWDYEVYSIVPEEPEALTNYLNNLKNAAITSIKQTAAAKILAVLPEYKQSNLTARAAELALAGLTRSLTFDEQAEITAGQAYWNRIKAIREHSNSLEELLNLATTVEDFDSIDTVDGWPE